MTNGSCFSWTGDPGSNERVAEYKFNEAAQTLYRFFWSEYCDWYLEASKAVFFGQDAAQKTNTLAVIDFVLSNTLRLFHPFLPFITEELWQGSVTVSNQAAREGGNTIMYAHWPRALEDDFKVRYGLEAAVEEFVRTKYELVSLGRNLRREGNIPSSKKVKFVLKPSQPLTAYEQEVIRILLNAEVLSCEAEYQPRKGRPLPTQCWANLFTVGRID